MEYKSLSIKKQTIKMFNLENNERGGNQFLTDRQLYVGIR